MLNAVLTTDAAVDPMDISEAQEHLKVDGEATYINELLVTSRGMVERYLGRSLTLKTWTAYADRWCEFLLPYGPLLSVTSVKYYAQDGTLTTLASSNYWVDNKREPGRVTMVYDFSPPELQDGRPNAIEILYTAGYLASGTAEQMQHAIPDQIRHGLKVLMTDLHEHRGQYVIGSAGKLPGFVADLLHPYRLYNF
jgi:uncharacterized phiE125 gp8 family phage protein